ncbi:MAG: hypothetical protein WC900_08910 [Oscillospiraceae bacterium]|jgi:hypothetical protein
MNKFIFADAKRLKKNCIASFIAVSIPFWQLIIVVVITINYNLGKIKQPGYYKLSAYSLCIGLAGIALVYTAGFLITHHIVSSHVKHSYIEITSRALIISRFSQKTWRKFKPVYYKRLYVIDYKELESLSLFKGKIIVKGKIKTFYDRADRLSYSVSKSGITFDRWWFDYNPLEELSSLCIKDIYKNSSKASRLVKKAAAVERDRLSRFNSYKAKVLEKLPCTKK